MTTSEMPSDRYTLIHLKMLLTDLRDVTQVAMHDRGPFGQVCFVSDRGTANRRIQSGKCSPRADI